MPPAAIAVAAEAAPILDGRGSDAVWQQAPAITEFVQYFPRPDEPSAYRTEVRFAYDSRNLYVLARMFDPAPDSILARLGRRDVDYPADWFGVTIDGYRDRRTGQEFRVSAGGGLFDAQRISDGQPGLSPSWDGVWDAHVSTDTLGWTAEFRIPFSQIRFDAAANPVFGLLLRRNVGRDDSEHAWPRVDAKRVFSSWVSQGGDLRGLSRVGHVSRLELTPYSVTKNVAQPHGTAWTHPTLQAFGADMRYGITSTVSLSATVNPDFGQVEADPAQLNLSAYELFFPERRPFFLEGNAIFNFQSWCDNVLGQGCTTAPLYTRRIGRAPQLAGRYGSPASPLSTRIVGAAKLSGRLGGRTSFGVMQATTAREVGTQGRTIEPLSHYLVLRGVRDATRGRGELGGLVTVVRRELDEWTTPLLRREGIVGGLNLRWRFGRDLQVSGAVLTSMARGSRAAITAMQRDGVHRFQRIGSGLSVDTSLTSLGGYSTRLVLGRVGGAFLWEASYQALSPGFDMNDLGYQRRADQQSAQLWAERATRNGPGWYRERLVGVFGRISWTMRGLPIGRSDLPWPSTVHAYAMHRLRNTGQFNLFVRIVNLNAPADDFVARGGPALRTDQAYNVLAFYRSDARRRVVGELQAAVWQYEQKHAGYESIIPGITLRPTDGVQASLLLSVVRWREDQQWYANRGASGHDSTHYTFVRSSLLEVNPTLRLDWTLSPRLTMQYYAQPYLAGTAYSNWRELADPRAERYADRLRAFTGPNAPGEYTLQQLRSNAVLRWEFRPGSVLYAVWQQRRDGNDGTSTLGAVTDGYQKLFGLRPDNTFVLKVSYWFNP